MDEFKKHGVVVSRLLTIIGTHCFSYEPVFNWRDTWLPLHHATLSDEAKRKTIEPAPNPEARELVMKVRQQIVDIFTEHGAASNQIGRTYPYASILHPESAKFLKAVKSAVDPDGLVNPGALELN